MTQIVKTDALLELRHERRALGSWAYKAHLTAKYVEQLRQFVDAQFAQNPTDARNTRIIGARPAGNSVALGVDSHAAKLDAKERTSSTANALLPNEYRFAALEENRDTG